MYKLQATIRQMQENTNSIFRTIMSVSSWRQLQGMVYPPTLILYEVLPEVYPLISQSGVNNRIAQLRQAGYLIVIEKSKEPIPSEYIGRMTVWNELMIEAPILQMIEVGYFDKIESVP